MAIDLKNLSKVIALCRKTGVQELEVDGIKLRLTPSLPPSKYKKKQIKSATDDDHSHTDEEILFWSAGAV